MQELPLWVMHQQLLATYIYITTLPQSSKLTKVSQQMPLLLYLKEQKVLTARSDFTLLLLDTSLQNITLFLADYAMLVD